MMRDKLKSFKLVRITLLDDDGEPVVNYITDDPAIIRRAGEAIDLFELFAEVILGANSTERP